MSWECAVDGDPCDLLHETTIKAARKEHRCAYCASPIRVGKPYGKWFWVYDGEPGEEKYHHECKALMYSASEVLCGEAIISFGSTLDGASSELLALEANDPYWYDDGFVKEWHISLGKVWEEHGYGD